VIETRRASKLVPIPVDQLKVFSAAPVRPPPDAATLAAMEAAREAATEAAVRGVRGWRFEPTRMYGRPINDWVELTVRVEPLP
jgi:hypothetical protein